MKYGCNKSLLKFIFFVSGISIVFHRTINSDGQSLMAGPSLSFEPFISSSVYIAFSAPVILKGLCLLLITVCHSMTFTLSSFCCLQQESFQLLIYAHIDCPFNSRL